MNYEQVIMNALDGLRLARNNMFREEFEDTVRKFICPEAEDGGNRRYPLLQAGMVASKIHNSELRRIKFDAFVESKQPKEKAPE